MKKSVICIIFPNFFALLAILLSYYLKKQIGFVFYNWIMIFFIIVFILYSSAVIFTHKSFHIFIGQVFCCSCLCLMVKLDLPDRFALLIEVPKIEKKIEKLNSNTINDESLTVCDDYIIFDWEPGFLDYQWVLVYDEKDTLQNTVDSKKMISEGRLYILYRAKKCFYLCILYR